MKEKSSHKISNENSSFHAWIARKKWPISRRGWIGSWNCYFRPAIEAWKSRFFTPLLKKIYIYKVNLKILWHLAQGTLFGGCLGPQFSTYFSIIKTQEMEDYSTQCCLNLWKNEKRLFFYEFNISFPLIIWTLKMVLNNLTLGIPN